MAIIWPKYGPQLALQISFCWILINVPRHVPCQISYCWVYPVVPFPRNGQDMAFLYVANKFSLYWPSNWCLLNLNQYAQGCFLPNFTLLGISSSPLSSRWQKYGPLLPNNGSHMVLQMCSSWIQLMCPGNPMQNFTVLDVFCNNQNMALLWPKHGPHMILQIIFSWFLINRPKDVQSQSLHCWVYPVAAFPRNSQNIALLWPKQGPSNLFSLNPNQCVQVYSTSNFTLVYVFCSPHS